MRRTPTRERETRSGKMKRGDRKVAGRSVVSRGMPIGCGRLTAAAAARCGTDKTIGEFSSGCSLDLTPAK
jgi:hypothetical protein